MTIKNSQPLIYAAMLDKELLLGALNIKNYLANLASVQQFVTCPHFKKDVL